MKSIPYRKVCSHEKYTLMEGASFLKVESSRCPIIGGVRFLLVVIGVSVVVQFYPWFKFYFPLFWCMVMNDNEFKTKENKI